MGKILILLNLTKNFCFFSIINQKKQIKALLTHKIIQVKGMMSDFLPDRSKIIYKIIKKNSIEIKISGRFYQ